MPNPTAPLPFADRTLGDIVKQDPRAAAVLERFGLDYCCGGGRTLQEATATRRLDLGATVEALQALGEPVSADRSDDRWEELDTLTAHIVQRHHRYVREMTPPIQTWLAKLVARHGAGHPELAEVRNTFDQLTYELATRMAKEENSCSLPSTIWRLRGVRAIACRSARQNVTRTPNCVCREDVTVVRI
jgi:iron-sulfur cluster repair di-iron protein